MAIQKPRDLKLAAVPALTGKAIESVTIVITTPIAAVIITIRPAIDRCVPEPTDHGDGRNIDPHSQIRVCLCRNAGTNTCNYKRCAHCNG
jgi:hypothetical protein